MLFSLAVILLLGLSAGSLFARLHELLALGFELRIVDYFFHCLSELSSAHFCAFKESSAAANA